MNRRELTWALVLVAALATCLFSRDAGAWGGYTHTTLANKAADEVIKDGTVTINGRTYAVPPQVAAAMAAFPASYNGGVIGPDGFPDLTFGQAVIHPLDTGEWLRMVFTRAWQAQGTPDFQQNLAFAYGFLSHGAGDMWGHTLVNKYAGDVFPEIGSIVTDIWDVNKIIAGENFDGLTNAARHEIVEYYVNDATKGYDGNPEFGLAPFSYPGLPCVGSACNFKNSSAGVPIEGATNAFIYNTLIGGDPFVQSFNPGSGVHPDDPLSPSEQRGPIIGFFLQLRSWLIEKGAGIDPVQDFTNLINDQFNTFKQIGSEFTDVIECIDDIGFIGPFPNPLDVAECVGMVFLLPGEVALDILSGSFQSAKDSAKLAFDSSFGLVLKAYLSGWVRDIDDGLRAWNEVGLQSSRGLFDPQSVREIAEMECNPAPFGQTTQTCKEGFGLFNRIEASLDDFKSKHLWFMLGLPHWVSAAGELLSTISDAIDGIINLILPINPVKQWLSGQYVYFQQLFEQFVKQVIKSATGIDINALQEISKSPEAFLDVTLLPPDLVKPLFGFTPPNPGISLFNAGDHPQLDALMALPADHHVLSDPPLPGWPAVATRLTDSAEFNQDVFAAAFDTVQQTRLLFLDAAGLNAVMSDVLRDQNVFKPGSGIVYFDDQQPIIDTNSNNADATNQVPTNVMFNAYQGSKPWLRLIDGDHSWRKDGLPIFGPRPAKKTGGIGQYPAFAACTLRPAFRAIFKDWEHASGSCPTVGDNFCDDGDLPQADPLDDPPHAPPQTFTQEASKRFVNGSTIFVSGLTTLTLAVPNGDGPFTTTAANGKPPAAVGRWRATGPGGTSLGNDQTLGAPMPIDFNLAGPDGVYNLDFDVQDPCHLFVGTGAVQAFGTSGVVTLDTTPPVITIAKPVPAPSYTTAQTETITFSATDGVGSGVKTLTATLDGTPVVNGQVLDFFLMSPGEHTLIVTSADQVGNQATKTVVFRIQATAASLLLNWDRARSQGLIPEQNLYDTYRRLLVTAAQQESAHQWTALQSSMNQFAEAVLAARNETVQRNCTTNSCKRIDVTTATRLVTFADLLQANAGVTNIVSTSTSEGLLELLDNLFIQRQIGFLGSYNALRHLIQQAIGHDKANQKPLEKGDLQAFVQQVAAMKSQTGPSCTNPEGGCYGVSSSAATALTAFAQVVIGTL
jgi:hypothetical protein